MIEYRRKEVEILIDKSEIKEVVSVYCDTDTNSYLNAGWVIIETAGGQDEDGSPVVLRVMGRI